MDVQNKRKNNSALRLTIVMVEREALFGRNKMGNGQSRCDQKTRLRAGQIQSSRNQSLNPEGKQGFPHEKPLR